MYVYIHHHLSIIIITVNNNISRKISFYYNDLLQFNNSLLKKEIPLDKLLTGNKEVTQ